MAYQSKPLSDDLELAVLRFWAAGATIRQLFSQEEIISVPGLAAAIEAINHLPDAIGWGDEDAEKMNKDAEEMNKRSRSKTLRQSER